MASKRQSAAHRGRRFLATMTVACLSTAGGFVGGTTVARADPGTGSVPNAQQAPSPPPIAADPSPSPCSPPFCPPSPSPTLTVIEISPVPPDPRPVPTTPSYLRGLPRSPSPTPQGTDSNSSPLPLVGGFVDPVSPSSAGDSGPGGRVASTDALAPGSSGPPLPLLAVGALLILGAVGSLIYTVTPRNKPVFDATRRRPAPRPGPEGDA